MQSLCQRRQLLDALWAIKECRRAGDEQVQPRKPAAVHLVDQLPESVEGLLPNIATNPPKRLHFVEHHHETGEAAVPQHYKQALQERPRTEMVHVALDPGSSFGGCCDVRLSGDPRQQRLCGSVVAGRHCSAIGPEGCAESRCDLSNRSQALLHQVAGLLQEFGLIRDPVACLGQDVFLQCEKPSVDNATEGPCSWSAVERRSINWR